jgi:hypothetical protein
MFGGARESLPGLTFSAGAAALGGLSIFGKYLFEELWSALRPTKQHSIDEIEGFQLPAGVVGFATLPQLSKAEEKARKAERQRELAMLKLEQENFAKK